MSNIVSIDGYYKSFLDDNLKRKAQLLFQIRNNILFLQSLDADKRGYITFDQLVRAYNKEVLPQDYLSYPAMKISGVLKKLMESLRQRIQRDNVLMPLYKANEFNSKSIMWLSKRPGRTVKEKLSGTASIMAVRRQMSLDTSENRLLKTFSRQLEDAIILKNECIPSEYKNSAEEILLFELHRFYTMPELEEVLPWNNAAPNNSLLSDKNYNVVWRAWNEFQRIAQCIQEDDDNLTQRLCQYALILFIQEYGRYFHFLQLPIIYEYDNCNVEAYGKMIYAISPDRQIKLRITSEQTAILLDINEATYSIDFEDMRMLYTDATGERKCYEIYADSFESIIHNMVCQQMRCYECREIQYKNVAPINGKMAIADVFSLRPQVFYTDKCFNIEYLLLFQQIKVDNAMYNVECFNSPAITYPENELLQTYTVAKIVADGDRKKSSQLQKMIRYFNGYVHTENIVFIYPDSYSEFQLSLLKYAAKMYYHSVRTVPKSLSTVFTFINDTENFENFSSGDILLLVDKVDDSCSITLVKSIYDKEVKKRFPEYKGLVWEQHPAENYSLEQDENISPELTNIIGTIGSNNCVKEYGYLCYNQNGEWLDFNDEVQVLNEKKISCAEFVKDFCKKNVKLIKKNNVYIILLQNSLQIDNVNYNVIDYSERNILAGVNQYDLMKKQVKVALWRACLPDLAIKRLYKSFDLVKNSTFEYDGRTVMNIPIGSTFSLPKGKKEYHFMLHMSNSNDKSVYEAVVRHRSLPLSRDVECRLDMKYSYGEDNPYSLKFIPLDKRSAGFNEAVVQWEKLEEYPCDDLQYPKFPPSNTWESLRVFPRLHGNGTEDILKTAYTRILEISKPYDKFYIDKKYYSLKKSKINSSYTRAVFKGENIVITALGQKVFYENNEYFYADIAPVKYERYTVDLTGKTWFVNRNGIKQLFSNVIIDGEPYEIVFFENMFIFSWECTDNLGVVSFAVQRDQNGNIKLNSYGNINASDVLSGESTNLKVYYVRDISFDKPKFDYYGMNKLLGSTLFCMHEIYTNGRYTQHPSCPIDIRLSMKNALEQLYNTYKSLDEGKEKTKLLNMLCIASRDVNPNFARDIYDYVIACANDQEEARYEIGFILGDCTTATQQKLLVHYNSVLHEHNIVAILAKAAWRNERFLLNIPKKFTHQYLNVAIDMVVNFDRLNIKRPVIILCLEYIMAVFRLRVFNNKKINRDLSLNNVQIRNLYKRIEWFIEEKYFDRVNSRIHLAVNQSVEFSKYEIDDFFYALLIYITGDAGDSDIIISSISS